MPIELEIERLRLEVPASWSGNAEQFRSILERAIQEELMTATNTGQLDTQQLLRVDLPPITISDVYDLQGTAREIARRIVQTIRQNAE
jgi:hypothetical protein